MFKIETEKGNDKKTYEVYYTNEYQELKRIHGNQNAPYYDKWENIPYGLTVTDICYENKDSINYQPKYTFLLKNLFFPIAVKKNKPTRKIIPLTEDEYWALHDQYYENDIEVSEAREEIFRDYYSKSAGDSLATEMAANAHVKCKMFM